MLINLRLFIFNGCNKNVSEHMVQNSFDCLLRFRLTFIVTIPSVHPKIVFVYVTHRLTVKNSLLIADKNTKAP